MHNRRLAASLVISVYCISGSIQKSILGPQKMANTPKAMPVLTSPITAPQPAQTVQNASHTSTPSQTILSILQKLNIKRIT